MRYVASLSGELPDNECDAPAWENYIPYPTRVPVIMHLSPAELTELFSALLTGSQIIYPEKSHEVLWRLWQALECREFDIHPVMSVQDNYATDESAPVATPRTDQPLGETTIAQAGGGEFEISGDALVITSLPSSDGFDQLEVNTDEIPREGGLCVRVDVYRGSNNSFPFLGFTDSTTYTQHQGANMRITATSDQSLNFRDGTNLLQFVQSRPFGTTYTLAIVLGETGSSFLIKAEGDTEWTLGYVGTNIASANVYGFASYWRGWVGDSFARFRFGKLGGLWQRSLPLLSRSIGNRLTLNVAIPHDADFVVLVNIATVSATEKKLAVRYVDANNYYYFRIVTGATEFYEVVAGGAPVLRSAGGGSTNNQEMQIHAYGQSVVSVVNSVVKTTYYSATNFQTATVAMQLSGDLMYNWRGMPKHFGGVLADMLEGM